MKEKKRKADDKVAQNVCQFIPHYHRTKSAKRALFDSRKQNNYSWNVSNVPEISRNSEGFVAPMKSYRSDELNVRET